MIKNILLLIIILMSSTKFVFALDNEPLKITLQSSKITLDPGGIQDSQSLFISRQINCQLFRSEGATYVNDAVSSAKYENPSRLILTLSKNARFNDGSQVTAQDVIDSLNYIEKRRSIVRNLFGWIKNIEAVNNSEIAFNLQHPTPQFLRVLSTTNYTIYKSSFLKAAEKNNLLWHFPEGCGGYKVFSFGQDEIKLIPVKQGLPINFYLSKNNQIEKNDASNFDIITVNVDGSLGGDFKTVQLLDPMEYYIGLNTKSTLFKSKKKRCDFLSKLDVGTLVKAYGAGASNAIDLIPSGVLGHSSEAVEIKQIHALNNVTNIKVDNTKVCLAYLTVSVQNSLKNSYISLVKKQYPNLSIMPMSSVKQFGSRFRESGCNAIIYGWRSNYWDGYEFLTVYQKNDANFSGVESKNLSKKIKESQYVFEPEKRVKRYHDIVEQISDLCIVKPLYEVPMKIVFVKRNIQTPGIGLVPFHLYYLGNITRDNL